MAVKKSGRNSAEKMKKQDWRPSRDEKAPYIDALNDALADERITPDEHEDRLSSAEAAASFAVLDGLVADLPFEWHDPTLERQRRSDRRGFILGAAALVGIAASSWAGTRTWVTSAEGRGPGGGAGSSDGATPPDSPATDSAAGGDETVPTKLMQVENWRADTVPSAVEHAAELGVTMVGRIFGGGDDFTVSGTDKKDQWMSVNFRKNSRPTIAFEDDFDTSSKWISPDDFPDVDVAKLYREVKPELAGNKKSHQLDIGYDQSADQWQITISDGSAYFSWTLDGLKRVTTR